MYEFLLITIMVVDEHGEGLPVAWAITDATMNIEYLTAVKGYTGNISTKIFMSDDADAFYNAGNLCLVKQNDFYVFPSRSCLAKKVK